MNKVNYDKNEVTVTGCNDCPFCHYRERFTDYNPFCCLDESINIEMPRNYGNVVPYDFPDKCPLRNPNFKIVRNIK